jgi:hypothetical protein
MDNDSRLTYLGAGSTNASTPMEVIEDFFQQWTLEDVKQMLDEMLYVVLTRDSPQFDDGIKRDNAIFFCRKVEGLVGAALKLQQLQTTNSHTSSIG